MRLLYKSIQPSRERDGCLIQQFVDKCYQEKELAAINRVRKVQESIFLLDIATANVQSVDRTYVTDDWQTSFKGILGKHCSNHTFGKEISPEDDWQYWRQALDTITTGNLWLNLPLGKWMTTSHRIWRTLLNEANEQLEVHNGVKADLYRP